MVQVIPRKQIQKEVPSKVPAILFWGSLIAFALCIGLFLIFNWQTKKITNKTQEIINEIQQQQASGQLKKLQDKLTLYQGKLKNIPTLLASHKQPSIIFEHLLKNFSHPNVVLNSLNLITEDAKLSITGLANDNQSLAQQIKLFEDNPNIKEVSLKSVKIGKEGKLEFSLELILQPEYLNFEK